jgi:outer membrane protein W
LKQSIGMDINSDFSIITKIDVKQLMLSLKMQLDMGYKNEWNYAKTKLR